VLRYLGVRSGRLNQPCVKVSGSKIWQTERSCMCCQEMGEREATVALFCPKAAYDEPKVRKVF